MKKFLKKTGQFFKAIKKAFKRMFLAIIRYVVLVYKQMLKMRWPTKKMIIDSTMIVIVFMVFMGVYFIIDDFIIVNLLRLIGY